MNDDEPVYDRDHLPPEPAIWPTYRKKVVTRAIRMQGPFTVQTSEGPLRCADGYLAIDSRGYPYPIAADEFEAIYEPDNSFTVTYGGLTGYPPNTTG